MNKGYADMTRQSIAKRVRDVRAQLAKPNDVTASTLVALLATLRNEGARIRKELAAKPAGFEADPARFSCPDGPFCSDTTCKVISCELRAERAKRYHAARRSGALSRDVKLRSFDRFCHCSTHVDATCVVHGRIS